MKRTGLCLAALLVSAACASSSEPEELQTLKKEVAVLQNQLDETKRDSAWPNEYQTLWVEICEVVVADAVSEEELSVPDLCRCGLDGLMNTFSHRVYESWPQDVKDAAAAPFFHMCWLAK